MNIYIAESGSFLAELGKPGKGNINCTVAIVMSDGALAQWEAKYSNLPKASDIKEPGKAMEIVDFLVKINAKAFLVLTDISLHNDTITEHKNDYAHMAQKNISASRASVQNLLKDLPTKIQGLSEPSYIKAFCFVLLSINAFRGMLQSNLSADDFKQLTWRYDYLNDSNLKDVFKKSLLLELEVRSHDDPFIVNDQHKISHFIEPTGRYLDLAKIYNNSSFIDDEDCSGIKAADCIANFIRRSLTGSKLFENTRSLATLFDLKYSVDVIHFDKDQATIETTLKESPLLDFINSKLRSK